MIFNRIIPSVLLMNFRLVKGKNFKDYIDAGDPVKTIKSYCDQGADEIILSIIDDKKIEYKNLLNEISKACNIPLCIYGNVKSIDDAQFYFRSGADKIGISSYGLIDQDIFEKLSKIYGSEAITSTINYTEKNKTIFNQKTKLLENKDIIEYLIRIQKMGVGEIKITNFDREGTLSGPDKNIDQLLEVIKVPVIIEGGISNISEISSLFDKGINSVALGAMLVFKDMNIVKIKSKLFDLKKNIRLN